MLLQQLLLRQGSMVVGRAPKQLTLFERLESHLWPLCHSVRHLERSLANAAPPIILIIIINCLPKPLLSFPPQLPLSQTLAGIWPCILRN